MQERGLTPVTRDPKGGTMDDASLEPTVVSNWPAASMTWPLVAEPADLAECAGESNWGLLGR